MPGFSVSVAGGDRRLDYVIYGRHWDAVLSFCVLAGATVVVTVTNRRELARWLISGGTVTAVAAAALKTVALPGYLSGLPIAAISVGGIAPWIDPSDQRIPLWEATATAVVSLVILLFPPARWWMARLLLVGAAFTLMAWRAEMHTMRPLDRPWQRTIEMQSAVEDLDPASISYDVHRLTLYGNNGYAYWLHEYDLHQFDSSADQVPTEVVISRTDWADAERWRALPYASETRVNETIWVMPGELQDQLLAADQLCRASLVSEDLVDRCS
ncbi:MAG: hypothetical protein R2710_26100 [Acidimicrobiales bacterium]